MNAIFNYAETMFGYTVALLLLVGWLAGIVLAKGFWSTSFAFFPPYAWYLVVEKVMQVNGWV